MKNATKDRPIVDLRSDTVTRPTAQMREAMFKAPVGDDVLGDDPTVQRLEALAARKLGKPAALFVPSGTMGNQIAIRVHTQPGDEVIVEQDSHSFHFECAGAATLAGVQLYPVPGRNGILAPEQIAAAIRPSDDIHVPRTRLVIIENTHNMAGGTITTPAQLQAIRAVTAAGGVALHIDGARLFNASVALGVAVTAFTQYADSIMFCLSKGLGAPIGSLLVGEEEWIARARQVRKLYGGGMRQVGIIAAAGIVALESMVARLAEDHANAQLLARGLGALPEMELDPPQVETNIVFVRLRGVDSQRLIEAMQDAGILAISLGERLRFVTHKDVSRAAIEYTLEIMPDLLQRCRQ